MIGVASLGLLSPLWAALDTPGWERPAGPSWQLDFRDHGGAGPGHPGKGSEAGKMDRRVEASAQGWLGIRQGERPRLSHTPDRPSLEHSIALRHVGR